MGKFDQRSEAKEIMDDLDCAGQDLEQTLAELKFINRWLGGNNVTTGGLQKIFKAMPREKYLIADIGCGGGDMIKVMQEWTKQQKSDVKFLGIDANRNIIELAKVRLSGLTKVSWRVQNVFEGKFLEEKIDIATCTLFTHHFTDSELVQLIHAIREKASLGLVINDLHRHPAAYFSIKFLTRLFSKSKMVQHDAPLSVLRAFSRQDWKRILNLAQVENYTMSWHWAFRWQLVIMF